MPDVVQVMVRMQEDVEDRRRRVDVSERVLVEVECLGPAACARKTIATAIFKPVSRPPISQWRKADQPIPMA